VDYSTESDFVRPGSPLERPIHHYFRACKCHHHVEHRHHATNHLVLPVHRRWRDRRQLQCAATGRFRRAASQRQEV